MGDVSQAKGKLCCSCGYKLGAWDWAGMRCSCGVWIAPAFHVVASRVDLKTKRKNKGGDWFEAPGIENEEYLLPSLQWLRLSPPPCVVIVAGPEPTNDQVRNSVSSRWAGRHVKDTRSAWLFIGSLIIRGLNSLVHHVQSRGVPAQRLALGGIGLEAAMQAASAAKFASIPFFFALSVTPDDFYSVLWPNLLEVADGDTKVLVILTSSHQTVFEHKNLCLTSISRLEPGIITDAVVRTLCTWLTKHLPGFEIRLDSERAGSL
uniref:protein-tyrosine-phosphatase n=1 Tax=Aureoumbra lagunensis TaxID=44058 RepID=A0A7S3JNA8_9STRA